MDRYRVLIDGTEYTVVIDGDQVWIDGQPVYAGIHFLNEDGLFMVEQDTGKREYHIKLQDDGRYLISTRGLQVDAMVETEKGTNKKQAEKMDISSVNAPIPAVVMNVLVDVGDAVEQNQTLVVLESMKMLMDFRSPYSARITEVLVAKGQKVEKGDMMIRLDKL